ncbi:MAG: hypothetical protein KDB90_04315 [Planctomycetes bacterium]|nr:hypothetical protein [Planctomycetota bacterium]
MSHSVRMVAAIIAVTLFGLTFAGGQAKGGDKEGDKLGKPDEAGKLVMRGTMEDVPLSELVQLYSTYSGRALVYDPKKMSGSVTFVAPHDGTSPTAEDALRGALNQFRLTLVSQGPFDEIVPMAEMCTMAEVVTREELRDMPALRPVRTVVQLRNVDAGVARAALQNLLSRQGGTVNPVESIENGKLSNAVIVCDFAKNVRDMLKVLDALDGDSSVESRVIRLKHVKVEDIFTAVQTASRYSGGVSSNQMTVGTSPSLNALVITGAAGSVDRVAQVVAQLDVESGN